jgi:hypothetical protein
MIYWKRNMIDALGMGDFNPKKKREENVKPTIYMFILHKESNGNGIRLFNYAASVSMITGSTDLYMKSYVSLLGDHRMETQQKTLIMFL